MFSTETAANKMTTQNRPVRQKNAPLPAQHVRTVLCVGAGHSLNGP